MSIQRLQLAAGGTVAVIAAVLIFTFFAAKGRERESELTIVGQGRPSRAVAPDPVPEKSVVKEKPSTELLVHVAGEVKKPGVYHFKSGDRTVDAVKSAGGATDAADLNAINLAAQLTDGTQLHIPKKSENAPPPGDPSYSVQKPEPSRRSSSTHAKFSQPGKDSHNLNTSSAEQLQMLPGVGPAMAARIIAHRKENGPFSDPEQLQDVSGIGPKKFEKMKPFLRIK